MVQGLPDQRTTARGPEEPKVTAIELKRLKELTTISTCEPEVRKVIKSVELYVVGFLVFLGGEGRCCFACFYFALPWVLWACLSCFIWFGFAFYTKNKNSTSKIIQQEEENLY